VSDDDTADVAFQRAYIAARAAVTTAVSLCHQGLRLCGGSSSIEARSLVSQLHDAVTMLRRVGAAMDDLRCAIVGETADPFLGSVAAEAMVVEVPFLFEAREQIRAAAHRVHLSRAAAQFGMDLGIADSLLRADAAASQTAAEADVAAALQAAASFVEVALRIDYLDALVPDDHS
jgi:hypothetical protein